jgi:hypothetical protein
MRIDLALFVFDALAAYRLTRLITEDDQPFGRLRDHLAERHPAALITEWVHCPWCAGMWVATGVVVARAVMPKVWSPTATVLALSATVGLLATWE